MGCSASKPSKAHPASGKAGSTTAVAAPTVHKTTGSEHRLESVDSSERREEPGALKDSRVHHDAQQGATVAAAPVSDVQRDGDADVLTGAHSALGAAQKAGTSAVDPAGGSANSQVSAFRTAVQSSFGSSAGSASSELRSPQSSFEGQNCISGGCSSTGTGTKPLIAMYHHGALPPRPQPAAAATAMPVQLQASAIIVQAPSSSAGAAAAAAAAASALTSSPDYLAALVRSLAECSEGIVLVDVHTPRWPLLFANDSFRDLADLRQSPMAADAFFWDEFSLLASDGLVSQAAEPWGQLEEWVQRGERFTVNIQRKAGGRTEPLSIHFKPAEIGMPDQDMVPNLVRSFPRAAADQTPTKYFFGTSVNGPASDNMPVSAPNSGSGTDYDGSGGIRLSGMSAEHRSSANRSGSDPCMGSGGALLSPLAGGEAPGESGVPFDDVSLGGLLGKGSFGSVFYGWWNDTTVAIKVIEHKNTPAENVAAKEELEATLGLALDHPNIVRTFKYANRELAPTVKATKAWRASLDRARGSVELGGPSRKESFDLGTGGYDAMMRPSIDETRPGAAPGRAANNPGRAARVRAGWDTSGGGSDETFSDAVGSPSIYALSSMMASSHGGSQRHSGGSSRTTGRVPGLDDVPDMVSFKDPRSTGPRRLETWIVLELCGLGSLQSAIDEGAFRSQRSVFEGKPDMHVILPTALEIASALAYLHSNNVLHGDLTTNNVLLVEAEEDLERPFSVKVSDFGLSRVHASESAISTNTFGTVTHMPPELLSEGQMSKAADVYAMGVLLWELYMGERPWAGLRPVQIILKKSQGKARLTWPDGAPAQYRALSERCQTTDYKQRPTFAEVAAELAEMTRAEWEGRFPSGPDFACYEEDWADGVPLAVRRRPSLPVASNPAAASLPLSAN